jgi:hypothetical protein
MGILESIFFRGWPRPLEEFGPPDLDLDLNSGALGSFHINDSTENLKRRLGPPISWNNWRRFGEWHYPQLGLLVNTDRGAINEMLVVVRNPREWTMYPGWRRNGRAWTEMLRFPDGFKLGGLEARPEHFLDHAGKPGDRDEDEFQITLYYASGGFGYEADFLPSGELTSVQVYSLRD